MKPEEIKNTSTTGGLPISPTLNPSLRIARIKTHSPEINARGILLCVYAVFIGLCAAFFAKGLMLFIDFITNVSFFGKFSFTAGLPENHIRGLWVIIVPVIGGLIVGIIAKFGSEGVRGHGIPEAMEQILLNESRIPARLTILKPLSAVISIGTGGPFGAEGPIIATGGAFGSFCGQLISTTVIERRILLAAGAAAGLTATFACPVAAVILAVELLLFEYRSRSLIPVALACVVAEAARVKLFGPAPVFPMFNVIAPNGLSLAFYVAIGAVVGLASVYLTRLVHTVEETFEHMPIHWMWYPAIGAIAVGVIGFIDPRSLGVGYVYIERILSGSLVGKTLFLLGILKFVSWTIYVGSGTSGGTLAPMFIMGGALGAGLGDLAAALLPHAGIDPRIAALIGMAAIFTGASRAFLTSVILALETTHQPLVLLPVFGGCSVAYLISCYMMPSTIMTEKFAKKGRPVSEGFTADFLAHRLVKDYATYQPVTLAAEDSIEKVLKWLKEKDPAARHQGFPVTDPNGCLLGVLTHRDFEHAPADPSRPVMSLIKRPPVSIGESDSLREATDRMAQEKIGRLPVTKSDDPTKVVAMITRSDIFSAYSQKLREAEQFQEPQIYKKFFKNVR